MFRSRVVRSAYFPCSALYCFRLCQRTIRVLSRGIEVLVGLVHPRSLLAIIQSGGPCCSSTWLAMSDVVSLDGFPGGDRPSEFRHARHHPDEGGYEGTTPGCAGLFDTF